MTNTDTSKLKQTNAFAIKGMTNYLVHVHCSGCEFRASQRSPRRLDVLKNGATAPSMTSSHSFTAEARTTRNLQKVSSKLEIAGFCIDCMEFQYVEKQQDPCKKCNNPLAFFSVYKERSPLGRIWDGLTGKATRCSLCNLWVDSNAQVRCGKCKEIALHGVNHDIVVH